MELSDTVKYKDTDGKIAEIADLLAKNPLLGVVVELERLSCRRTATEIAEYAKEYPGEQYPYG
jgi:hypothetical protein